MIENLETQGLAGRVGSAADYLYKYTYLVHILIRVQFIVPVQGTGTSRSGPGLNVCWLIKDRKARL